MLGAESSIYPPNLFETLYVMVTELYERSDYSMHAG